MYQFVAVLCFHKSWKLEHTECSHKFLAFVGTHTDSGIFVVRVSLHTRGRRGCTCGLAGYELTPGLSIPLSPSARAREPRHLSLFFFLTP